ncbi:MAG: hypothetical protein QOE41_788, partial [Mycobacterium sp.]|nr:hypothetical protein [Mycobacterium sp.]
LLQHIGRRPQRGGPWLSGLTARDGEKRQLAWPAQNDLRRQDHGSRRRRQPVPAVGADTDDNQMQVRGRHVGDASVKPANRRPVKGSRLGRGNEGSR